MNQSPTPSIWRTRLEATVFALLILAIASSLAYLSQRYRWQQDWTAAKRNSLSEGSAVLVRGLEEPLEVVAYAREEWVLRQSIRQLLERYQREQPNIRLRFVNPEYLPDETRDLGITVDGELVVLYRNQRTHAKAVSERALSTAIERAVRQGERWLTYVTGHGERDLLGKANHDLGQLGEQLRGRGFQVQPLELASTASLGAEIPANTRLVVLSQPQNAWLPGEWQVLEAFLRRGGNLLWLSDPTADGPRAPGDDAFTDELSRILGIQFSGGVIMDPAAAALGIKNPAFVPAYSYGDHPAIGQFNRTTLFPRAKAVAPGQDRDWDITTLVSTTDKAWVEVSTPVNDQDRSEVPEVNAARRGGGPYGIALGLVRDLPDSPTHARGPRQQRVVVVGDGDFLSNTYIGNGGNLQLGLQLINWLARDDNLIEVPPRQAMDLDFELSRTAGTILAFGFLVGLPLALLGTGFTVWHRRRGR